MEIKHVASVLLVSVCAACGGGSGRSVGDSLTGGTSANPTAPSSPTPTSNRNPTITAVSLTPTFGVSGLTTFSMSATANDPDGDSLSYSWSFAGGSAAGPSTSANLTGDGPVNIRLTVSDGKGGTAVDSRDVTLGNMTGRWTFIFTGVCSPNVPSVLPVMTLTQAGSVVTGDLASPAPWCNVPAGQTGKFDPAAPGRISATGAFTGARLKIGSYLDTFLDGQMDGTGRVITGTTRTQAISSTNTFRMVKQ